MAFTLARKSRDAPAGPQAPFIRKQGAPTDRLAAAAAPQPSVHGTAALLAALAAAALIVPRVDNPASTGAQIVGAGLLLGVYFDLRLGGLRNLIRADLAGLLAFYFLTFFEFLFPQANFNLILSRVSLLVGVQMTLIGFAGVAIGRHLLILRGSQFSGLFIRPFPRAYILLIFWISAIVGYFHMLWAVDFNIAEMVHYYMEPRFTQPWSRGRLGDWRALLIELGMFLQLIPPLGGIILARRAGYRRIDVILVGLMLLWTLFYGFTSGTRYLFASYLLSFVIGYAFAAGHERRRELVVLGMVSAAVMVAATVLMLEFRDLGFNKYVQGERVFREGQKVRLSVDYNLYSMSRVMEVFPKRHPYLGWEIVYMAIIRPIPRAIWKGKPEGLSVSIEQVMGAEGWTVATTFVGEAYMGGGPVAVFFSGLILGAIMGWWSQMGSPQNSEFGILVYASGFFAVVISMRSLFTFTTAILPTIGGIVLGTLLIREVRAHRASMGRVHHPKPPWKR